MAFVHAKEARHLLTCSLVQRRAGLLLGDAPAFTRTRPDDETMFGVQGNAPAASRATTERVWMGVIQCKTDPS